MLKMLKRACLAVMMAVGLVAGTTAPATAAAAQCYYVLVPHGDHVDMIIWCE